MMGKEVRERIIEARQRGITVAALSKSYGVSGRSIFKLQALYRSTGSIVPRTHTRGRKSTANEEMLARIGSDPSRNSGHHEGTAGKTVFTGVVIAQGGWIRGWVQSI